MVMPMLSRQNVGKGYENSTIIRQLAEQLDYIKCATGISLPSP